MSPRRSVLQVALSGNTALQIQDDLEIIPPQARVDQGGLLFAREIPCCAFVLIHAPRLLIIPKLTQTAQAPHPALSSPPASPHTWPDTHVDTALLTAHSNMKPTSKKYRPLCFYECTVSSCT